MKIKESLKNQIEQPKTNFCIYGLIDPRTNKLKYIGLTTIGFERFHDHYSRCFEKTKRRLSPVKMWIKELREAGLVFKVKYFEFFDNDGQHLDNAEAYWIKYHKDLGINLLNVCRGRRADKWYDAVNVHYKMSEIMKELYSKPEMKQKISETTKAAMTEEVKQKMSLSARKPKSKSHATNIRKGQSAKFGCKIQDDLGNIYNSQMEVAIVLGVKQTTIHKAIYGEIKLCKGRKLTLLSGGRKDPKDIKVRKYIPIAERI
jgi:hypothetical protein